MMMMMNGNGNGEGGWAAINHGIDESSKCEDTCQVSFDFSTVIKDRKSLGFYMQISYKSKQKFQLCLLPYLSLSPFLFHCLLFAPYANGMHLQLCIFELWPAFLLLVKIRQNLWQPGNIFNAKNKRRKTNGQKNSKKTEKKRSPKAHKSTRRSPAPTSAPILMMPILVLDQARNTKPKKKRIKSNVMHKSHKNEISHTREELQQKL